MAAFLFFELLYQKLANFNMFATWNPQKFLHEQLIDLPTLRIRCSHCTLGNPTVISRQCYPYTILIIFVIPE